MTQTMYALAPQFFIFGSDGNIRANSYTKQVLGSWKKIEPRKDFIERHRNKHTGHISRSLVLCATRLSKPYTSSTLNPSAHSPPTLDRKQRKHFPTSPTEKASQSNGKRDNNALNSRRISYHFFEDYCFTKNLKERSWH